jgi:hypothetical protein
MVRVDVTTGARTDLIVATSESMDRPMFGPGGHWMTFNARGGVRLAPVYPDRAATESEWVTLVDITGPSGRRDDRPMAARCMCCSNATASVVCMRSRSIPAPDLLAVSRTWCRTSMMPHDDGERRDWDPRSHRMSSLSPWTKPRATYG